MKTLLFLLGVILAIQLASSYVMLSANINDLHQIADQVISHPIRKELAQVWRRAAQIFKKEYNDPDTRRRRDESGKELEDLGKTVGRYLKKLKKILRNFEQS